MIVIVIIVVTLVLFLATSSAPLSHIISVLLFVVLANVVAKLELGDSGCGTRKAAPKKRGGKVASPATQKDCLLGCRGSKLLARACSRVSDSMFRVG